MVSTLKVKTLFRCQECGYTVVKWLGRCPDCGKWNSLVEEQEIPEGKKKFGRRLTEFSSEISTLTDVSQKDIGRLRTGLDEFDNLLGGGVVSGSLLLLGGSPGIGKSTLMLQVSALLSRQVPVLYVSGEESLPQIKSRAERLKLKGDKVYLLSETNLERIIKAVHKVNPKFLIIDSIQTTFRDDLSGSPGTVGQVRECAAEFLNLAKTEGITVCVLGHVTKEGDIAGPRVLEHIVDTVLYFEEEKHHSYRILRSFKNRFGPTDEIGLFEMTGSGLRGISNASDIFLSERDVSSPGCVVVSSREGSRPLLLEIQALVSHTPFGFPKRQVNGIDYNRTILLVAVLEKKLGLHLETEDIFVNVVGGIRIKETSVDLGVCAAIASSFLGFAVDPQTVFIGEVGLAGEIRTVPHISSRIKEAERLGFTRGIIPARSLKECGKTNAINLKGITDLKEALEIIRVK